MYGGSTQPMATRTKRQNPRVQSERIAGPTALRTARRGKMRDGGGGRSGRYSAR